MPSGCFLLLLIAPRCSQWLKIAPNCFRLLLITLIAQGCFRLLRMAFKYFWLLPNASGCFRARPGVPLGPRAQATSFSQQAILPEGDFCALHNAGSPAAALEQPLSPTCLGQAPVHYLSQRFGAVINLSILPPFTVLAISQLRAAMVAITTLSRVYLHNEVTRVMSIVGLTTSIGVFLAKFGIAVWM